MLYLLDANVVITASNYYYPIDAVPEFWSWLAHHAANGNIKMPLQVFDEVRDGGDKDNPDPLFEWLQANRDVIVLAEEVDPASVGRVITGGYAADLTDDELEQIGKDPFLIAYALSDPANRCVVTNEASSTRRVRQNRRIPDVCGALGAQCTNPFVMMKTLKFSTGWQR
ncbi:MAG: DUF4411 family protein [Burkholderiales bacterium]